MTQQCPTDASFSRVELEEMMQRWKAANDAAETLGNWSSLADFYTSDDGYSWGMGPNREFIAHGREEIRDIALGWYMKGFARWKYPYYDIVIDDQKGAVVAFYHQVSPDKRSNGEPYQVDGVSGSRFQYAGNYQWKWQRDFFDMGNVMAVTLELAGEGFLDPEVKEKVRNQVRGTPMPLIRKIRPTQGFLGRCCTLVKQVLAMLWIIVVGV
jgi:hypothetical protein